VTTVKGFRSAKEIRRGDKEKVERVWGKTSTKTSVPYFRREEEESINKGRRAPNWRYGKGQKEMDERGHREQHKGQKREAKECSTYMFPRLQEMEEQRKVEPIDKFEKKRRRKKANRSGKKK